jgi:hypothetical protein
MANQTHLIAPANRATEVFLVASLTGAEVGGYIRVDDEFSVITELAGQAVVVRSRGSFGGASCAHPARAPVTFGKLKEMMGNPPSTDTPDTAAGASYRQASLSSGGNLDLSAIAENTEFHLVANTNLELVLNRPARLEQEGLRVRFTSSLGWGHTIENICLSPAYALVSKVHLQATRPISVCEWQAIRGQWLPVVLHYAAYGGFAVPPPGVWYDIPYHPTDFLTTNGNATWTVPEASVGYFRYTIIGLTAIVAFDFGPTTITGGTTNLQVVVPPIIKPTGRATNAITAIANVPVPAGAGTQPAVLSGGSYLSLARVNDYFAVTPPNLYLYGQISYEIGVIP